jgi:uncharacterized membrane protein YqjE
MAGSMRFSNPAGYPGLSANLSALVSSGTRFIESRLALASKEAKSFFLRLVLLVGCVIGAAILLLLGYLFLLVFAIVGIAHLIGISWIWVALVVALLHFVGALFCLILARGQMKHPMFRETAGVLKEDTAWLKNLDQAKAKRS